MEIKKLLKFNKTLGLTLPKKYCEALDLRWGDYVEVSLEREGEITIRKHRFSRYDFSDYDQKQENTQTATI